MEPSIVNWTLQNEISAPEDVSQLFVQGEQPVAAFRTLRGDAIFTTKRLIVRDAQRKTATQMEVYSLLYTAIDMWSLRDPSTSDRNSELELWTNIGNITVLVGREVDVRRLHGLIAWAVLQSR